MKGSEIKLVKYMEGANTRFVIPVYQRNYDWRIGNCKQLFDDLVKVIKQDRKSHFFGSLVSFYNPKGSNTEFLVIDGQQRLTTISLLLLAMHNLLEQNIFQAETPRLMERIMQQYLVDPWALDDTKMKLKPIHKDQKAYTNLFDRTANVIPESNLTLNYQYFYDRIQMREVSVDELFEAINRLEIISIVLDHDDNPQLIFESLNSTGLALTEGDKIRNYILIGLPPEQQEQYYRKYWSAIESNTNRDVSSFIRDYMSLKKQTTPPLNKVYLHFREYVEDGELEVSDLLSDLLAYSKLYESLLGKETGDRRIDGFIYRMNRLETTVTRPYLLEILNLNEHGVLSTEQVVQIFRIVESYIFRRSICEVPTNALNKVFVQLHKEVLSLDDTLDDYVNKLNYVLLSKRESGRYPNDAEFLEALSTRLIYLLQSKTKMYLLERFENWGTLEVKSVYDFLDDRTFSIEHIMPQSLSDSWIEDLGEDYEEIHNMWLHRLANLTLTAYNSNYSNLRFLEKRDRVSGFASSGIRMNSWIAAQDKWGLDELMARDKILRDRAIQIWPQANSTYERASKLQEFYNLSEDVDLTGRDISKFRYRSLENNVNSWADMFKQVVSLLHEKDPAILHALAHDRDHTHSLSYTFSSESATLRNPHEIARDLYIELNNSTQSKQAILNKLFVLYDEDPESLVFYLRPEISARTTVDDAYTTLRRKYWEYTIPILNQRHGNGSIFRRRRTSGTNWLQVSTGYRGCDMYLNALVKHAGVGLYILKEVNSEKTLFDDLYKEKETIEGQLKVKLLWDRKDEAQGSLIQLILNDVSVEKEEDWPVMASFQADWSKKLLDVFGPYLDRYLR